MSLHHYSVTCMHTLISLIIVTLFALKSLYIPFSAAAYLYCLWLHRFPHCSISHCVAAVRVNCFLALCFLQILFYKG